MKKLKPKIMKAGDQTLNNLYINLFKKLNNIQDGTIENRQQRVDSDIVNEELQQMYKDSLTVQQIKLQEEFVENTSRIKNIRE